MKIYNLQKGTLLTAFIISCLSFCSIPSFAVCPLADLNGDCRVDYKDLAIMSSQWMLEGVDDGGGGEIPSPLINSMTWVYIDDPGFNGNMSKYETTNAQYCEFLNAALATGDIYIEDVSNYVNGANGSNSGIDFEDIWYYPLYGSGWDDDGALKGGAVRIHYNGSSFIVDEGFESHPVTYVTWNGATAFCNYYGWRLPKKEEWVAVADYDGSYEYGCGISINNSIANYGGSTHPDGTTIVGAFGAYGYEMCDMAGNVREWTEWESSNNIGSDCYFLGGSWVNTSDKCLVRPFDGGIRSSSRPDTGFRVCCDQDPSNPQPKPEIPKEIEWITINDPGVSGHSGLNGKMCKYEITNTQYAKFLNAALTSGDIVVEGNYAKGASGSNSGVDFAGKNYYQINGGGSTTNGAIHGGASRINYNGSTFTVDSGFENHPVTYITWYGATAYCNYYGWRLPTEWEWQAVADYDGSYTYGCGTTIDNCIANYKNSVHPNGTTAVGKFGTYGYGMCDMAGNVWEWTSSVYSSIYRAIRGGSWNYNNFNCSVSYQACNLPNYLGGHMGFRACR